MNVKLPPVPLPDVVAVRKLADRLSGLSYSERALRAYAREAIELDRQGRGEPVAFRAEALELSGILAGMVECGDPDPNTLYTEDQPDGDHFVSRAATLLRLLVEPQPTELVVKDSLTTAEPVKVPSVPGPLDKSSGASGSYIQGWNACRKEFLAAAPAQPVAEPAQPAASASRTDEVSGD